MDDLLKEQGFQQTGSCDSDACIVQAGRILGVPGIIVGSVGRVGQFRQYLYELREYCNRSYLNKQDRGL